MIFSKKKRPKRIGWYYIVNNLGQQIPRIVQVQLAYPKENLFIWDKIEGWIPLEEMEKRDYYWGDEILMPNSIEMKD